MDVKRWLANLFTNVKYCFNWQNLKFLLFSRTGSINRVQHILAGVIGGALMFVIMMSIVISLVALGKHYQGIAILLGLISALFFIGTYCYCRFCLLKKRINDFNGSLWLIWIFIIGNIMHWYFRITQPESTAPMVMINDLILTLLYLAVYLWPGKKSATAPETVNLSSA